MDPLPQESGDPRRDAQISFQRGASITHGGGPDLEGLRQPYGVTNRLVNYVVIAYLPGYAVGEGHLFGNHLAKRLGAALCARVHTLRNTNRAAPYHNLLTPVPYLPLRYHRRTRNQLWDHLGLDARHHLGDIAALGGRRRGGLAHVHALSRHRKGRDGH